HAARERALHVEGRIRLLLHPRDGSGRWSQPDQGAEAGRGADAAAEIIAGSEPYLPRRQGSGRATGRPTRRVVGVPWIAGDAEHVVERIAARGELRNVALADHQGTVRFQPL